MSDLFRTRIKQNAEEPQETGANPLLDQYRRPQIEPSVFSDQKLLGAQLRITDFFRDEGEVKRYRKKVNNETIERNTNLLFRPPPPPPKPSMPSDPLMPKMPIMPLGVQPRQTDYFDRVEPASLIKNDILKEKLEAHERKMLREKRKDQHLQAPEFQLELSRPSPVPERKKAKIQPINLNDHLDHILDHPFACRIKEPDVETYALPVEFPNESAYRTQFGHLLLDEIRANLESTLSSDEFKKREKVPVELAQLTTTDGLYFLLNFPSEEKKSQRSQNFMRDIERADSLIVVLLAEELTGKMRNFLGIRVKRRTDRGDMIVFRFSAKMSGWVPKSGKLTTEAKYLDSFVSYKREVLSLQAFGDGSDSLLTKLLNRHSCSHLRRQNAEGTLAPLSESLNPSQREAVSEFASNSVPIGLIQGPPGTGKSHTVIELIRQILATELRSFQSRQILVCTPSNNALDELILRFAKSFDLFDYNAVNLYQEINSNKIKILRVGKLTDNMSPAVLKYSMENIIRLKFEGDNLFDLEEEQAAGPKPQAAEELEINRQMDELARKMESEKERPEDFMDFKNRLDAERRLIRSAKIIFSTLNSSAQEGMKHTKGNISVLIVDEATQATETQTLIPFLLNPLKMVLVGDPMQLPATTFHPLSSELRYNRSLFERLLQLGFQKKMLKVQYRMSPILRTFPSFMFYGNQLGDGANVQQRDYVPESIARFCAKNFDRKNLVFLHVEGLTVRKSNSYFNKQEVGTVQKLIRELHEFGVKDVGVISPYKEQVYWIKRGLRDTQGKSSTEVNTVDGFQGREKDVIILSSVKSLREENGMICSLGFLTDQRRLNVSITRAKYLLIIVGNVNTLEQKEPWKTYTQFLRENRFYFRHFPVESRNSLFEEGEVVQEKNRTGEIVLPSEGVPQETLELIPEGTFDSQPVPKPTSEFSISREVDEAKAQTERQQREFYKSLQSRKSDDPPIVYKPEKRSKKTTEVSNFIDDFYNNL